MRIDDTLLRREIDRANLSVADFAKIVDMTPQAIYHILQVGQTTFATLAKIGKALDIDPRLLLK